MDAIITLVFAFVCFYIYFLPSFIAHGRSRKDKGAIIALNTLLGFTFVGWVVALVWSLTGERGSEQTA